MSTDPKVAAYISKAPPIAGKALRRLRTIIRSSAPGKVTERISYGIPTFDLDGKYLLYIAAFKSHVSVYPVSPAMVKKHGKAIEPYRSGRGTLRFALEEPLPFALVAKLAKTRVQELRARSRAQ